MGRARNKLIRSPRIAASEAAYRRPLFAGKNQTIQALQKLKDEDFPLIVNVLGWAAAIPAARPHLFFAPFPSRWSGIGRSPTLLSHGSIEAELWWETTLLLRYSGPIAKFLSLKRRFEEAILLSDFSKASEALTDLHSALGYSLWSMAAAFLLEQLTHGLEGNKTLRKELVSQAQGMPRVLAHCFSMRTEDDVSAANYNSAISDMISRSTSTSTPEHGYFPLNFLANFHSLKSFPDEALAILLSQGPDWPVLDRFENLVRVLTVLVARTSNDTPRSLSEVVAVAAATITDERLQLLNQLLRPEIIGSPDLSSTEIFSVLDRYTRGEYEQTLDLAQSGLVRHPSRPEYYELYAKAVLHLAGGVNLPPLRSPIQVSLLQHIIGALRNDSGSPAAAQALLKVSYSFEMTALAQSVFALGLRCGAMQSALAPRVLEALSASTATPRLANALVDPNAARAFLFGLARSWPNNTCVALFNCVYAISPQESDLSLLPVPSTRQYKYTGFLLEQRGLYPEAAAFYEKLLASADSVLSRTDAEIGLYTCYFQSGQIDKCTPLAVDAYIARGTFVAGADVRELVEACDRYSGAGSIDSLVSAILISIAYRENLLSLERLSEACEEFLDINGCRRPSELLPRITEFGRQRLVFFLRHIALPEILDHSVVYESTHDLEEERITICQQFRVLDPDNETEYAREISRLTTAASIRKAMQTVGVGKIHADTEGIVLSLDDAFREDVDRYLKLHRLDPTLLGDLKESLKRDALIINLSDEAQALFAKLFNEVKSRLISSNEYGLDSFLSVRIRHGTLAGQLRSVYERQFLLTRREAVGDRYHRNEYWLTHLNADAWNAQALDESFQRFATDVDNAIDEVRDLWLQIRGEPNHNKGLFNFDYTPAQLVAAQLLTANIQDYAKFLDGVFAHLWLRTEQSLEAVRASLTTELGSRLMRALDRLDAEVTALVLPDATTDLHNAVANCRTELNNTLLEIAGWFALSEAAAASDFQIELAIRTSLEIIQSTFPTVTLIPQIDVTSTVKLSGRCLPHLLYALYILLENVVKHAGSDVIAIYLAAHSDDDTLCLSVANALAADVDVGALQRKAAELEAHANQGGAIIRREGGSGYYKLGKILTHDLKARRWRIAVSVVNGTQFKVELFFSVQELTVRTCLSSKMILTSCGISRTLSNRSCRKQK